MPWMLIAASIAVAVAAFVVRGDLDRDSVVVVRARMSSQGTGTTTKTKTKTMKKKGKSNPAAGLPVRRKTTTEKAMSDGVLTTLLGIAAALFLLGAFYTRVSKVSIAGNSVELHGGVSPEVAAQDVEAIADAIEKRLAARLRTASGGDDVSPDQAAEIAKQAAAAAARAQQEAASIRLAASAATAAVPQPPTVTVDPGELEALGSGMPLPPTLLERLADEALAEPEDSA
jgi:hypothetical protein